MNLKILQSLKPYGGAMVLLDDPLHIRGFRDPGEDPAGQVKREVCLDLEVRSEGFHGSPKLFSDAAPLHTAPYDETDDARLWVVLELAEAETEALRERLAVMQFDGRLSEREAILESLKGLLNDMHPEDKRMQTLLRERPASGNGMDLDRTTDRDAE